MFTIKNKIEDNYFLPADSKIAQDKFMELIAIPEETYISCYGFTIPSVFSKLLELDSQGVKISLMLDYVQGSGTVAKPLIRNFVEKAQNADLILTTAGSDSQTPSAFWHLKGMVKVPSNKRKAPICLEGSANFTLSAFHQANTMRVFQNKLWANEFIEHHNKTKSWAKKKLAHYQPMVLSDGSDWIDYFFDNLKQ
jgi:hypothetical protein